MFDNGPFELLMYACGACGSMAQGDPDTVMTVLVDLDTRCGLNADGVQVKRGDPNTSFRPLCVPCTVVHRRAGTTPGGLPITVLFPAARFDRIDKEKAVAANLARQAALQSTSEERT